MGPRSLLVAFIAGALTMGISSAALAATTGTTTATVTVTGGSLSITVPTAAATIEDGSFLGAAAHTQNDLSTWTSVYPESIDVAAKSTELALVSMTVPTDAAPGEQYGVVWAEVRSAHEAGGGIVQVSRVGIRLYVSVGPGNAPAPDFTIDSLTAIRSPDGRPAVLATVRNTGGRAVDISGTLQLSAGPGGLGAGPFPANLGTTLAIGDTEPVTFVLDKQLPAGPWDARITLRSGLLARSARATITFPNVGAAPPVRTASTRPGWLYPAAAGVVVLLTLSMVAQIYVRKRRLGDRLRGTSAQPKGAGQWT